MEELISITEVAKALGCSYFTARNRLAKNAQTKALAYKVGHSVVYKKEVLEVLRATTV